MPLSRILLFFSMIILLLLLSVYLFIPNIISINTETSVAATKEGLFRQLTAPGGWRKWWPGSVGAPVSPQEKYIHNQSTYTIDEVHIGSFLISVNTDKLSIPTHLVLFPDQSGSLKVSWQGNVATSYNPFKRMSVYLSAKKIKNGMNEVLLTMGSYFSNTKNLYEINIQNRLVVDSILIFKNATIKGFPGTTDIYQLVKDVKTYIASQSAREAGKPMLNITTADSIYYLVKVAIPVNKRLAGSENLSQRLMPADGKILYARVKGGYAEIKKAFSHFENYITDYKHLPAAIPFESMVTDRSQQPDSSQWITDIYYPIMY